MAFLNKKEDIKFKENDKWNLLFVIADIYTKFSDQSASKNIDFSISHPLKDYEVIQLLKDKYNINNVKRQTIALYRQRLEEYFGYEFGTFKKGKYITNIEGSLIDEDLLLLANLVHFNRSLGNKEEIELIETLKSLALSSSTRESIEQLRKIKLLNKDAPNINDTTSKLFKIQKAINEGNNISFDYSTPDNPYIRKLTITPKHVIFFDNKLQLIATPLTPTDDNSFETNITYPLHLLKNVKIIKKGKSNLFSSSTSIKHKEKNYDYSSLVYGGSFEPTYDRHSSLSDKQVTVEFSIGISSKIRNLEYVALLKEQYGPNISFNYKNINENSDKKIKSKKINKIATSFELTATTDTVINFALTHADNVKLEGPYEIIDEFKTKLNKINKKYKSKNN